MVMDDIVFFFCKQKTAYKMRISDWSSDVYSSDRPEVGERFLQADRTPDKKWIDWMLFQAGGGKDAKARGAKLLEGMKDKFLSERVSGYENRKSSEKRRVGNECVRTVRFRCPTKH